MGHELKNDGPKPSKPEDICTLFCFSSSIFLIISPENIYIMRKDWKTPFYVLKY